MESTRTESTCVESSEDACGAGKGTETGAGAARTEAIGVAEAISAATTTAMGGKILSLLSHYVVRL